MLEVKFGKKKTKNTTKISEKNEERKEKRGKAQKSKESMKINSTKRILTQLRIDLQFKCIDKIFNFQIFLCNSIH